MKRIYLDYAATTPTDPQVVAAMEPYFFDKFGNASSPHAFGREASGALEAARKQTAQSIGAQPEEIVFNSGATEGNNHAILGAAGTLSSKGKHMIVSSIEHHSVLEPIRYLQGKDYDVTYLAANGNGTLDAQSIKAAIRPETVLLAVMHASNEIGTIQPISEIGKVAQEYRIPFLVDASQTAGHIPVNVKDLGCDFLTFSGHKFYGPKGVGVLYIKKGAKAESFLRGGDQERNRRASTQNIAGAVGLAKALEISLMRMTGENALQEMMRDRLITQISQIIPGVKVNGDLKDRLSNNAHFSFEGIKGEMLLVALDMAGISCSMGSACTSGAITPSHVLRAIGLSDELALGSLRVTLGRWTTAQHIDYFLEQLPPIIRRLRK
jgi:cysteine desulfurase